MACNDNIHFTLVRACGYLDAAAAQAPPPGLCGADFLRGGIAMRNFASRMAWAWALLGAGFEGMALEAA